MAARPRIKASHRPLRRGSGEVQLGLCAESGAIIVSGLTAAEVALLERVDGSLSESQLYASAVADGMEQQRAEELLRLLRQHGMLASGRFDRVDLARLAGIDVASAPIGADPAQDPTEPGAERRLRRAARHVVVDGSGRLSWSIATLLRSGGTGRVDGGTWSADLVEADLRRGDGHRPDVVVLVAAAALDVRAGDPWRRRGIPHLPVVADAERVVVGPMVGPDVTLPCLRCVQLARADRDAGWPSLAAQALSAGPGPGVDAGLTLDEPLSWLAAAVVATVVTTELDGEPVPRGVSIEASLPWPRLDHRQWARHPACAGHGTAAGATATSRLGGSGGAVGAPRVTMTQ